MFPSVAPPTSPATGIIRRVVLLDEPAERAWAPDAIRVVPGDLAEADRQLTARIASGEWRGHAAAWAASALGVSEDGVRAISAPLRPDFCVRLLRTVDPSWKNAAVLCAEILGWQEKVLTDPLERWVASAGFVPAELLERWISMAAMISSRLCEWVIAWPRPGSPSGCG